MPGKHWELELIEKKVVPLMPYFTHGGQVSEIIHQNGIIIATLDYSQATVFARVDSQGTALINPPYREVDQPLFPSFEELASGQTNTRWAILKCGPRLAESSLLSPEA